MLTNKKSIKYNGDDDGGGDDDDNDDNDDMTGGGGVARMTKATPIPSKKRK